ncbi:MAG: OB-fold nucleic acid binding domain-containing protein, partial [Gemmataceae bacterium]
EGESSEPQAATLPDLPDWPQAERLKFEKEALDFYFSSHPLAQHEADLHRFSTTTLDRLRELQPNQEIVVGGMLTQVRFQNTKRARNGNSRYMRCTLVDLSGSAECVMWPDDFVQFKDEVAEDKICFVRGTVEKTREEPGLVLTKVLSVDQARKQLTRGLLLTLNQTRHGPEIIDRLADILQRSPGGCPVFLRIVDPAGKRSLLKAGQFFSVNPGAVPTEELEMILGAGQVQFSGPNGGGRR